MGPLSEPCSGCSSIGKPVRLNLVRFHVTTPWRRELEGKQFSFCEDSNCRVVYFSVDGEAFTIDAIRQPPAYKTGNGADLLCFCFQVTADDLAGRQDPTPYIRERVRRQECACDVLNPSGGCCLGSIGRWHKDHP